MTPVFFVSILQARMVCWCRSSFSAGSRSSKLWLSIKIPRKVRDVPGPSILFTATRMPSLLSVERYLEDLVSLWAVGCNKKWFK